MENPMEILTQWMDEAKAAAQLREPTAMVVATADKEGQPSSRVVLCKEIRAESLIFYTNYESKKGLDISANDRVAVNFFWDPLLKQIKLQGRVKKLSRKESEAYWQIRPRESQISQYVSRQSLPVDSRETLDALYKEAETQFQGKEVPCPSHWGGYEIIISYIEFWIGRTNRFHDRFAYKKVQDNWQMQRLFP